MSEKAAAILDIRILPRLASISSPDEADMTLAVPAPAHLPPSYDVSSAMESQPIALPPPKYSEVPEVRAEKLFWTGLLCPILWFIGASYLWRSQDPLLAARAKDPEAQVAFRFRLRRQRAGLATEPILDEPAEEMKVLWRLEERTWAKRCARALGVVFLIGGMVILVAVYTHVR